MTPTRDQWIALRLHLGEYDRWTTLPDAIKQWTRAQKSIAREEGWLVLYPELSMRTDIVLGTRLLPQRARDTAAFLRGDIEFSVLFPDYSTVQPGDKGVE